MMGPWPSCDKPQYSVVLSSTPAARMRSPCRPAAAFKKSGSAAADGPGTFRTPTARAWHPHRDTPAAAAAARLRAGPGWAAAGRLPHAVCHEAESEPRTRDSDSDRSVAAAGDDRHWHAGPGPARQWARAGGARARAPSRSVTLAALPDV